MADLTDLQAAQTTKIIGSDASGVEANPVNADSSGNMFVKDAADGATGAAVPTIATQVAGSDGTNLRAIKTDTGGQAIVNQGTAAAASGKWPVSVTDGTSTAAIKAASTAPLATDSALVVVQSPNGNHATAANQATELTRLGDVTETAPSTDIASSGLNGRLQRIAQRITSLIAIAATETSLAALLAKFGSLGQKVMSGSAPVVIASDQSALQVVGTAADGAAASGNPVQIAGKDGSGNIQTILTDTSGAQIVSSKIPLTASNPATVSIGVAATTVIVANAARKGLVVQNTSSLATVSLHLNNGTPVLNSGITLYPHDIWYMDEFTFTTAQIVAISSLAATPVSVQEMS